MKTPYSIISTLTFKQVSHFHSHFLFCISFPQGTKPMHQVKSCDNFCLAKLHFSMYCMFLLVTCSFQIQAQKKPCRLQLLNCSWAVCGETTKAIWKELLKTSAYEHYCSAVRKKKSQMYLNKTKNEQWCVKYLCIKHWLECSIFKNKWEGCKKSYTIYSTTEESVLSAKA